MTELATIVNVDDQEAERHEKRRMLEGAGYQRVEGPRQPAGVKLVRDPNCGTFVAPPRAVATRLGGETLYFCSEKCRREWERR